MHYLELSETTIVYYLTSHLNKENNSETFGIILFLFLPVNLDVQVYPSKEMATKEETEQNRTISHCKDWLGENVLNVIQTCC